MAKTGTELLASQTNTSGGSTASGKRDLSSKLGALTTGKITNGGTAPSTPCDMIVEVSHVTGTPEWKEYARQTGPKKDSDVATFAVSIPHSAMMYRVRFEGNDDQDVTIEAQAHELDSTP